MGRPQTAQGATPWKREYLRKYQREHRKAGSLTPEELEQCRQKPALAREIRGRGVIACLECGLLLEKLPQHLFSEQVSQLPNAVPPGRSPRGGPGMTSEGYKRKFGLPKNYPLCSMDFSEKMSAQKRASGYLPPAETRFGGVRGPSPKDGVEARRRWGVSIVERQGQRDRMLSKESRQRRSAWWAKAKDSEVSSWEIAEPRLHGQSQEKIAARVGLERATISWRLKKMGFPRGREFVLYHGEPLTRQHLPLLVQDYIAVNYPVLPLSPAVSPGPHEQFTVKEAAERLGVSVSWVRERTRQSAAEHGWLRVGIQRGRLMYFGNAQIQYLAAERDRIKQEKVGRRGRREITDRLRVNQMWIIHRLRAKDRGRPLSAKMGDRVLSLWKALKDKRQTQSASPKGGRPRNLLPSEESALPRRYQSLRKDLKSLLAWLRDEDGHVTMRRVREWICEQAQQGRMRTLLIWPEFFKWAGKGFDPQQGTGMDHATFLRGDWRPNELALEFLAQDYGLAPSTVKRLI
jgi:hypothetical protein